MVAAALAAPGCSSNDSNTSNPSVATPQVATACASDNRKDVYSVGLTKQAGTYAVKVVDANPGPPEKGTNSMTFAVTDGSGAPVDGATVTVTPFMPDHGHGSAVVPTVTPSGGGKYAVTNIYLAMAGLWRLTVTVQPNGGAPQDAAFQFCLDG
jgi:hypothetical protein